MKVLQLHNKYRFRGGEDVVVEREAQQLRELGVEVVEYHKESSAIEGAGEVLKVAASLVYSRKQKKILKEFLQKNKPDIVHVHNYFPLFTPSIFDACAEMQVPVVHTLHNFRMFCANGLLLRDAQPCELCLGASALPGIYYGCYQDSSLKTMPVAAMIESSKARKIWWKSVNAYICSTDFTKAKYVQAGLPAEKIFVKPNFTPDLSLTVQEATRDFAVYVGRLSEEKGIRTLVEAWRGLSMKLVFCGDGPLAGFVQANGFTLIQGVAQLEAHKLMAQAKFLVLPTECYEAGVPLVIMEALSLSVPLVISRFGAADQYFQNGQNAWVFEPRDGKALRTALEQAIQRPTERAALGAAGRQTYEKEFHPLKNSQALMEIYQRVIANSPKEVS